MVYLFVIKGIRGHLQIYLSHISYEIYATISIVYATIRYIIATLYALLIGGENGSVHEGRSSSSASFVSLTDSW